jgi:hypothetical protein
MYSTEECFGVVYESPNQHAHVLKLLTNALTEPGKAPGTNNEEIRNAQIQLSRSLSQ